MNSLKGQAAVLRIFSHLLLPSPGTDPIMKLHYVKEIIFVRSFFPFCHSCAKRIGLVIWVDEFSMERYKIKQIFIFCQKSIPQNKSFCELIQWRVIINWASFLQNPIVSYEDIDFSPTTFSILYPSIENSTNHNTIVPILIGGDFNIDLKSYSGLDKHADFLYVPYRPISGNLAKDLKNTFLFTVDSLQGEAHHTISRCLNLRI